MRIYPGYLRPVRLPVPVGKLVIGSCFVGKAKSTGVLALSQKICRISQKCELSPSSDFCK